MWEAANNVDVQPSIDGKLLVNEGECNRLIPVDNLSFNIDKIPSYRGMVMACLNINSLLVHLDELRVFVSDSKIDILCINETKLDSMVGDGEVCLPGFEIVRRDRKINGRKGGGICIYIRSNINYTIRDDLQSDIIENLRVEIKKQRSKSILVCTWYRPPDSPTRDFVEFEEMVKLLDSESLEYFLLGDLNVDLLPSVGHGSPNRNRLTDIFDIYGMQQLINEATTTTNTLIDLCLTNAPCNVVKSGVIHLSVSDHSLVYMIRKSHYVREGTRMIDIRSMKNFNREEFLRELEQKHWANIYLSQDPNEMWEMWKNLLMDTVDKHAPRRSRRIKNRTSPWITTEVRHKIFKRDYLKRKANLSNDPQLWREYRQARNHINNEIKQAKRAYFTRNLEFNRGDMKKTWKLINELTSKNVAKSKKVSELNIGDQKITASAEIAEAFNEYFSTVGNNLASEIPTPVHTPEFYLKPTDKAFSLQIPTVDTVYRQLITLDEKKSAGLDNIPNKILKIAADVIAPSLTEIFAASIRAGVFPFEWKTSRVTPIYKGGAKDDANNCRPISVISVVAKVFEKMIFDQLYEYLNTNKLLTACQSGFRSLHSTLTALLEATSDWSVNIDNGHINGVVFIDLKKAFDTIDHQILLRKLKIYGIDQRSLTWFHSYLTNRTQKCRINGQLSNSVPVACGVPQGSNLGPLLFLVYINDLPNCLNHTVPRMFADDTSISSVENLQNVINSELMNLKSWLNSNRLSLNVLKTEFMVIASHQKVRTIDSEINIRVNGNEINRVHSVKSLGVHIDEHFTWSVHIDKLCKKIASAIGVLKRIRPFITTNTAVQVYKAMIQPHFDYCCSVWDGFGDTLSCKLQKLQNRAARVITRSSYDTSADILLDSLCWDNLFIRRKKLKASVMFKALKGKTPSYLSDLFSIRGTGYNLRNSDMKLNLPKPRTNYLK